VGRQDLQVSLCQQCVDIRSQFYNF
jgi:hypothetical protein